MVSDGGNSLELLRENLQYFFNEKINVVMKDFIKTFFDPAIRNIKENTDETINEQQVKEKIKLGDKLKNSIFFFCDVIKCPFV